MMRKIDHVAGVTLYCLIFLGAGYFFSNLVFYIFLIPMAVLLVCDAMFPRIINKSMTVGIVLEHTQGYRYQQNKIYIRIYNPTFLFSSIALFTLEIKNSFTGEVTEQTFAHPIYGGKRQMLEIPISLETCGKYCFSVKRIETEGILGICSSTRKIEKKLIASPAYLYCHPENLPVDFVEGEKRTNRGEDGNLDLEDGQGPGMDSTEVSGIREYVPGDRIKDIHWKLSAKKDQVYVRERVSISQETLRLYLDLYKVDFDKEIREKKFADNALLSKKVSGTNLCGYQSLTDEILRLAVRFIKKMLEKNQPVEIVWRDQSKMCFQHFMIEEEKQLREGFYLIFESELVEEIEEFRLVYEKQHKLTYVCCKSSNDMDHIVLRGDKDAVIVREVQS